MVSRAHTLGRSPLCHVPLIEASVSLLDSGSKELHDLHRTLLRRSFGHGTSGMQWFEQQNDSHIRILELCNVLCKLNCVNLKLRSANLEQNSIALSLILKRFDAN